MSLNLKTNEFNSGKEKIQFGKILPLMIVLCVLILIAYFVILFFQNKVEAQISSTQDVLDQKTREFKNGDAKNVLDFQNRVSESNKLLKQYTDNLALLDEIQKDILSGVFLTDLKFDSEGNKVTLECSASDYEQVSKQILSFKKADFFSQVEAGETSIMEQEGLISFKVVLFISSTSLEE